MERAQVDTDIEAGIESTRPLEVLTAFDRKLKKRGIDFLYVPIPTIEEVYPENFLDTPPADLTVQPLMRRFLLSLLERDIETIDLRRLRRAIRSCSRRPPRRSDTRRKRSPSMANAASAG